MGRLEDYRTFALIMLAGLLAGFITWASGQPMHLPCPHGFVTASCPALYHQLHGTPYYGR